MIDFAYEITSKINMEDVFAEYGFTPNRAGFITCPFHSEKTASLKMYANKQKFKCFGCGEGGSVIDFVMKLFNLTFMQAVVKINNDFNIGLSLNSKPMSIREKKKAEKVRMERIIKSITRIVKEYEKSCFYADLIGCYLLAERIINENKPADNEKWSNLFAKAVEVKAMVDYELNKFEFGRR